jgi:hypothetical protein
MMISNTSDKQKNVDQIILIEDEYINDSDVEEIDTGTVILEVEDEPNNNIGPFPVLRRERHEISIVDVSKIITSWFRE